MESGNRAPTGRPSGLPGHERQFYAQNRAFGRFGMRMFRPALMEAAHWHGHIEVNLCRGAAMLYDFNGQPVRVPADRCVCFWAGVPHQLVDGRRPPGRKARSSATSTCRSTASS